MERERGEGRREKTEDGVRDQGSQRGIRERVRGERERQTDRDRETARDGKRELGGREIEN